MTVEAPPRALPRLLLGVDGAGPGRLDLERHLILHGAVPPTPHAKRRHEHPLLAAIESAGLSGRGGAAFPLARKVRSVRAAGGRGPVVVNIAESEPASRKDALLATTSPHLILDGAQCLAEITRAREVVLWLHRGDGHVRDALDLALGERARHRLDHRRVRIVEGPARYVAGQSSAVVRHLSGGVAQPTTSPPHATERGVGGRPTLIVNAETASHVALIARHGAGWFRETGTPEEPGTVLLTVTGTVGRPGVVEVGLGTPLPLALEAAAGPAPGWRGVLVGGYAGGWLSQEAAQRAVLSAAGLRPQGSTLGVGLLAVLPDRCCPVGETAVLARWLAGESAGQCGPCWNGLPALAAALRELTETGGHHLTDRLERWAGMVKGRGACHHPDGVALLVRSLLRAFPEHVDEHRRGGWCGVAPPGRWVPVPPMQEPGEGEWR